MNMALVDDLIAKSPVRQIDRVGAERPHRLALEPEQQAALLRAARGHYEPFIYIALSTGCRISELFDLRISDIDLAKRTMTIRNSKTAAGVRVLSLSQTDIKKIQHHLMTMGRATADSNEPLFVTPKGNELNYSNFRNRVFKRICKAAGLEDLQVHDLRRTCATTLIKAGVPHKEVQARLGHQDIRTTLNMYAESTREGRQHVATVMEEALNQATKASRHLNAVV
jgi:integrase